MKPASTRYYKCTNSQAGLREAKDYGRDHYRRILFRESWIASGFDASDREPAITNNLYQGLIEVAMESEQGLYLALVWGFLRIGLPVLGTGLLVLILSRLDSQWRQEAVKNRRILVAENLVPRVKCWILNDCPEEQRQNCQAYQEKDWPCWHVFRDRKGNLQHRCLGCRVFQNAPVSITDQ